MSQKFISRRQFLHLSVISGGAAVLAACGANASEPNPTAVPEAAAPTRDPNQGSVLVGDVVEHALTSDDWPGAFGYVTFMLHEGRVKGEPVYFIRTDASDAEFALENKLVNVPLLANGRDAAGSIYLFEDGRLPVLSSSPADENFASLFKVIRVTAEDASLTLESAEAIEQAAADGNATLEDTMVLVNYPVVKWPGGELSVDSDKAEYLGTGQLLEPVDSDNMRVTFKLHECYPGSRYIVTDTSAAPMAPMMSISAAPPTQSLVEAGGTDEIWVFANGIEGSGVMGFQPAIFDNQAGSPTWSPFWNHFTLKWTDESAARVLKTSNEIRAALESGEVEEFNGTPDSHPNGFVVNCPVPVLAGNTFEG